MYNVYIEKDHNEYSRTLAGEFRCLSDALDCAKAKIEGNSSLNYIVEETTGAFNSYGDLITRVVAKG